MPPRLYNEHNALRRVGVEIEFAGPGLDEVAGLVVDLFGGTAIDSQKFVRKVIGTRYGDFSVESDSNFLKQERYGKPLEAVGLSPEDSRLGQQVEKAIVKAVSAVFPSELVTPPIPLAALPEVEKLRQALYELHAEGTKRSLLSSFGLHLNPEAPSRDGETLLAFLRAFFLLQDWIVENSKIDLTRRAAPFIRPFPESYVDFVLDPDYRPTREELIRDYLDQTPSRNRPLDCLPLFASIDPAVADQAKEVGLVKPRPAFHYRLPNCCIDDPDWTIAGEWNRWVEVEQLAADTARIRRMSERYFAVPRGRWIDETTKWLRDEAA